MKRQPEGGVTIMACQGGHVRAQGANATLLT